MRVLFFILAFSKVDAACNFPSDLTGSWTSSTLGSFTFNSTHVSPIDVNSKVDTWECYLKNGNRYVLLSNSYIYASTDFVMFRCLDLLPVAGSTDKYLYYQTTTKNNNELDERIVIKQKGDSATEAEICNDLSVIQPGMHSFLLRDNSLSTSKIKCSDGLMTEFNVSMATDCTGGGNLDDCTDNTVLHYNYTTCGGNTHTGNLLYTCLYSEVSGSNTFLTLYDDAAVDPAKKFHCTVFASSENYTEMTIIPADCVINQTSTVVASPGFAMTLTNISTTECVPPTTTTISTTTASTTPTTTTPIVTTVKSVASRRQPVALWIMMFVFPVILLNWC